MKSLPCASATAANPIPLHREAPGGRASAGALLVGGFCHCSGTVCPCSRRPACGWRLIHRFPNGASGCILQKIIKTQIYEKTLFPSTFHLGCCRRIGPARHFEVSHQPEGQGCHHDSLEHPEAFLSEKAIERRRKQNLPIDSTDLPVCRKYVDEIRRQGVKIVVTGKWENFVTVSCNDSALVERIAALPFVPGDGKGMDSSPEVTGRSMATERDSLIKPPERAIPDSIYGLAVDQIRLSNGDKAARRRLQGTGMTIAVIDAGFHNADKINRPCRISASWVRRIL